MVQRWIVRISMKFQVLVLAGSGSEEWHVCMCLTMGKLRHFLPTGIKKHNFPHGGGRATGKWCIYMDCTRTSSPPPDANLLLVTGSHMSPTVTMLLSGWMFMEMFLNYLSSWWLNYFLLAWIMFLLSQKYFNLQILGAYSWKYFGILFYKYFYL